MIKVNIDYSKTLELTTEDFKEDFEEYKDYNELIEVAVKDGESFEDCSNKVLLVVESPCNSKPEAQNEPMRLLEAISFEADTSFITYRYATIIKEKEELHYFQLSEFLQTFDEIYSEECDHIENDLGLTREDTMKFIRDKLTEKGIEASKLKEEDLLIAWLL